MSQTIALTAPDGTAFDAYVARPDGEPVGGLIVIHEIWGLVDHIRDVADRFAGQGWLVVAPDILSTAGVEPHLGAELFALMNDPDEEVRTAAQPRMREAMSGLRAPEFAGWAVGALRSAVDWLEAQPGVGQQHRGHRVLLRRHLLLRARRRGPSRPCRGALLRHRTGTR